MSNKSIHIETLAKQLADILSKEQSSSETSRIPFGHLIKTCIKNLAETLETDPNKKLNPFIDIFPFKSGIDFDSFLKKELKIKILQDLGYEEAIHSDENDKERLLETPIYSDIIKRIESLIYGYYATKHLFIETELPTFHDNLKGKTIKKATALYEAFLTIPKKQRHVFENYFRNNLPKNNEMTLEETISTIVHTFEHTPTYFPSKSKRGPKENLLLESLISELGEMFYARTDKTWDRSESRCITKEKVTMNSLPCFFENFETVVDPTQTKLDDCNLSTLKDEEISSVLRRVIDKKMALKKSESLLPRN